jgi:metallo-beta-lactamase family protein
MTRCDLTFLGAADSVTGSRYLLETDHARVLVDCGLFQGLKKARERNWAPLPFPASSLHAVVLTHAHIDHSGYLPRLCNDGYAGRAYCTPGTRDLLGLLLPDSGFLQEEEARLVNRAGSSRHAPALPLYTFEDAERSLAQLEPRDFHAWFDVAPGITARFSRAGHIVGSACLALRVGERTITFSGDVGRPHDPIMRPPERLGPTDVLIVESTYGDRLHSSIDVEEALATIVRETISKGGMLIVPSFAVGRAQHMLHLLARLRAAKRIPDVPVHLDSPMAIDATQMFTEHRADHHLSPDECAAMFGIASYARTPDESKAITRGNTPAIVVAASGMCTGGRVLHHLKQFLPDPKSTVLFVGYQTPGTRGRALLDGAGEVKIHGEYVPAAARIALIDALSAHADYAEMTEWLRASQISPSRVFVTHGEPAATDAFRRKLRDTFGWSVEDPDLGERVSLA